MFSVMLSEVAVPLLAALFFEINALVIATVIEPSPRMPTWRTRLVHRALPPARYPHASGRSIGFAGRRTARPRRDNLCRNTVVRRYSQARW
jgi:hypothetical protein